MAIVEPGETCCVCDAGGLPEPDGSHSALPAGPPLLWLHPPPLPRYARWTVDPALTPYEPTANSSRSGFPSKVSTCAPALTPILAAMHPFSSETGAPRWTASRVEVDAWRTRSWTRATCRRGGSPTRPSGRPSGRSWAGSVRGCSRAESVEHHGGTGGGGDAARVLGRGPSPLGTAIFVLRCDDQTRARPASRCRPDRDLASPRPWWPVRRRERDTSGGGRSEDRIGGVRVRTEMGRKGGRAARLSSPVDGTAPPSVGQWHMWRTARSRLRRGKWEEGGEEAGARITGKEDRNLDSGD